MSELSIRDPLPIVPPGLGHVPGLDGLRAVSISFVLLEHFISRIPGGPPFPALFGVEIFFVISGLLISRLLLVELATTGGLSLARFYLHRALRLMPALAASVAAVSAFEILSGAFEWRAAACGLAYVTNYCLTMSSDIYAGPGGAFTGLWSLAVEEHFYLLFPLLLLLLWGRGVAALYIAIGLGCALALLARLYHALNDMPLAYLGWRTESACDFLLAGCLLSILTTHEAGRTTLRRLASTPVLGGATLIFALSTAAGSLGKVDFAVSQSFTAFWIAILVANVLYNRELANWRECLNTAAMNWLGQTSYSVYLWHVLIIRAGTQFGVLPSYAGAAICIPLSLILSRASFLWIEQPIRRRRRMIARWLGVGRDRLAPSTTSPI